MKGEWERLGGGATARGYVSEGFVRASLPYILQKMGGTVAITNVGSAYSIEITFPEKVIHYECVTEHQMREIASDLERFLEKVIETRYRAETPTND